MQDAATAKVSPAVASMTDEDLVALAAGGSSQAMELLLEKFKPFVRAKARSYYLVGADRDDIMQEGMIGLYKAIRDYRPHKNAQFPTFAEVCIKRQMITAIKGATRQKHKPLSGYISLDKPMFEDEGERTLADVLCDVRITNPEELIIGQEEYENIEKSIRKRLSEVESQVLALFLQGKSYQEIAQRLNRHTKSIDNALQRIRSKIAKAFEQASQL